MKKLGKTKNNNRVAQKTAFCVSFFPHDISKTDAARIAKHDTQMFHNESCKPIYFRVKSSKVKVTSHKNSAGVGHCTLVGAGFF